MRRYMVGTVRDDFVTYRNRITRTSVVELNTHPSLFLIFFFFSSRRRHTRLDCDWSSDVCSSDLPTFQLGFEHWAIEEEDLVYWSFQSSHPPPRRDSGTLLFQAGWPSDPRERPAAGNVGWKTSAGMLINRGDSGLMDRVEGAPTLGRTTAIEAQMRVDAEGDGAFGIWRQRV